MTNSRAWFALIAIAVVFGPSPVSPQSQNDQDRERGRQEYFEKNWDLIYRQQGSTDKHLAETDALTHKNEDAIAKQNAQIVRIISAMDDAAHIWGVVRWLLLAFWASVGAAVATALKWAWKNRLWIRDEYCAAKEQWAAICRTPADVIKLHDCVARQAEIAETWRQNTTITLNRHERILASIGGMPATLVDMQDRTEVIETGRLVALAVREGVEDNRS